MLHNDRDTHGFVVVLDILVSLIYSNRHQQLYSQRRHDNRQTAQQLKQNSINICRQQLRNECSCH